MKCESLGPVKMAEARIWAILEDFEREIVVSFKAFGTHRTSPKGEWIRGLLKAHPPGDYPYSMWKKWKFFCEQAAKLEAEIRPGTYQTFRTYIHLLKQQGLIRYYAKGVETPTGRTTNWYEIVPERQDDPAWRRPFQTKYPNTDWTIKTAREKARLRKKYPRRRRRATARKDKHKDKKFWQATSEKCKFFIFK